MGVRGLTSYIARKAELYLKPFELHDCNLVIDGDNLACNLYKDVTGIYSAFGGDYDDFFRAVVEFFHVLAECNVHPYVLMDGGYEYRKLRTVAKRLRGKIAVIKRINPSGSITVFPLLMKEVFVDALRSCNVPVMRCVFEADDDLAALGRKLNCPVLSYDSDFYIHNVLYIPLITLTAKAHTKRVKDGDANGGQTRTLHKNEVRCMEKRTKANRIMGDIRVDNVERRAPKSAATYKYMDCCIYRVESLIARGGSLSKEKLPLFAALLGNDYIARSSFKNFFAVGMGKIGRSKKLRTQQRRIRVILQWLKNETAESALEKILSRLRKSQKQSLAAQVRAATSGYSNEICRSYDFFVNNYENSFEAFPEKQQEDTVEIYGVAKEELEEEEDDEDTASEELEDDSDGTDSCEEVDDQKENNEENANKNPSDGEEATNRNEDEDVTDKIQRLPKWFIDKLNPAHLPRFFVDLMHLKKYINSPQVEHFPYNDCNEIALPILIYIFTLLNTVDGVEPQQTHDNDDASVATKPYFTYLTRATRVTNIRYHRYEAEAPPKYPFNPESPEPLLLRRVFDGTMYLLEADFIFGRVSTLPEDLQLYMLAIVYWLQKSQHCDLLHLHSLLVCLVVMRTVDSTIPVERDMKAFHKRFGKIIKKERAVRDDEVLNGVKRGVKEELRDLTIPDRMPHVPKSDCYLVQAALLKHFHMQEIFKKKYDLYSSTVVHAFAEFQCVVFQLHSLNALLNFPHASPQMGVFYCGVFLYNLYDLFRVRSDVRYYVEHFILRDSPMMFDFYTYLLEWCDDFVPHWKRNKLQDISQAVHKKAMKKQRQELRKQAARNEIDPNADMLEQSDDGPDADDFFDLNNKFSAFHLKV